MLSLKNNPVLTSYQIEILRIFFSTSFGQKFFLTGGTALAAFYLGHRLSKDLDFFSIESYESLMLEKMIEQIAQRTNSRIREKVRSETYNEIYFENKKDRWTQRVDFVRDQPVLFGKRKKVDFVIVDSLENIAAGKILTIFSRLEPKDYLDLYFICKFTDLDFFKLFEKTKKKDLGLNEFYFANIIAEVENFTQFPKTLKPFDRDDLVKFYVAFSDRLFKKIKPVSKLNIP